ncbi:Gallinacin-10-like [Chelydra serpentina]|uniref:Gallinacin-10-like n=1 Tax=Chelydra serpentina TaxID=8475 RepID=A0A8T1T044_CHESE|nr:Gallinacin-10-like [Chelydra serpentina]
MRILCLLFAVLVFLFQGAPGNADFPDNINCRSNFGFCHSGDCPISTMLIGTCINGKINCCKRPTAP